MAQALLLVERKEGAAILFSFLPKGLLTLMQRRPEQGISSVVGVGGGVSIKVSQGRPSTMVEAAIRTDGGQMRTVTSPTPAVTHFYFWVVAIYQMDIR